jgi:hypothetical protein
VKLFRVIFALPFLIWLAVWAIGAVFVAFVNWVATLFEGKSPAPLNSFRSGGGFGVTVIGLAAVFGWFYAMLKTRMPRGLRDLIAFVLSYAAQAWGYLLLVTDIYPDSDPLTAIGPLPTRSDPVRMEVTDELRRSRLTVCFRLALAFPHLVFTRRRGGFAPVGD